MALGLVGRKSFIPFVVFAAASLAQGCFTTKGDDDSSSKGCTKDTDCASGRICNNGTCMNQDASGGSGGSSGSGSILSGGSGGTSNGTGGNSSGGTSNASGGSSSGGTGNASGGTGNASGGMGNASGGTSSGGTGNASSGGSSGMCSADDPITCPTADSMTLCINGADETLTCDYACTELGFATGPCMEPDGCACGDPTDDACANGVNAFCSCISGTTEPCDQTDPNADPLTFYVDCHLNDPSMQADTDFLKCFGMQLPMGATISTAACQDAATTCDAASSGSGGSGGTGGASGTGGAGGTGGTGSAGMPPAQ